jgi:hypothetical protein
MHAYESQRQTSFPMSMPIEASGCVVVVSMGCFFGCCGVVFADYPRGGSSRSIPLADTTGRARYEPDWGHFSLNRCSKVIGSRSR